MGSIKEFKEFSIKGNVIDMAVGVIIGGAFGKIVTSLVNDIIMPLISKITGKINFTNLKIVLTQENKEKGIEQIALNYGNFIQNIVDFIIIALCIFAFIKVINSLKKQEEEIEEAKEDEPTKEEVLLTEIRDLLKQK
ncbi:large conductance mechanosensitive channel protein [Peptoanaerobacter stomatis]|uniref:Large-conductance mechanosensitive channel n=1 Tax=Peptoanaerobacter stomatis TaxID=796937 RepID=J6HJB6_9FIRM|nr:large-conductance mechanosensitive channel protein MscL [Peptoanaerobacter stomatis]EJU22708.1 large conductance mechanosensitive channel protein [Peptoanaerobacter stomatis]NWO26051.1 large-conductance mechanosensitive channel protein MscL [Peptostreptococcaceae bacterium oral taxon 081]